MAYMAVEETRKLAALVVALVFVKARRCFDFRTQLLNHLEQEEGLR